MWTHNGYILKNLKQGYIFKLVYFLHTHFKIRYCFLLLLFEINISKIRYVLQNKNKCARPYLWWSDNGRGRPPLSVTNPQSLMGLNFWLTWRLGWGAKPQVPNLARSVDTPPSIFDLDVLWSSTSIRYQRSDIEESTLVVKGSEWSEWRGVKWSEWSEVSEWIQKGPLNLMKLSYIVD